MKRLFVVSLPRSGSTLVQAVLSNHSRVATLPEPWVELLNHAMTGPLASQIRAPFDWRLCLDAVFRAVPDLEFTEALSRWLDDYAERMYLSAFIEGKHTYIIDKTPRYFLILNQLIEKFPDARFLIVFRNLTSVAASLYRTWMNEFPFRPNPTAPEEKSFDLFAVDLLEGPLLLDVFRRERVRDERVFSIEYESLVESPEETMIPVFEWLDLDWNSKFLDYSENESFQGFYGDPNCVDRRVLKAAALPCARRFDMAFPKGEWTEFARGLTCFAAKESFHNPRPEIWEDGSETLTFSAFKRRHQLRGHPWTATTREYFMVVLDRIYARFRWRS